MHKFILQSFDQLTARELYAICQAREAVFVVEQACAYQELDGLDNDCLHLQCWDTATSHERQLAAYARIIPPTIHSMGMPAIGRVLTKKDYRGRDLGRELMQQAIGICHSRYPTQTIYISAQTYLLEFYQSLGFVAQGDVYLEDDIPHIEMLLESNA